MYGDMWECMGIAGIGCKFFCGDEKNETLCVGNWWGRPHANFCVWGSSPCNFSLHGVDLHGSVIQGCPRGCQIHGLSKLSTFCTFRKLSYRNLAQRVSHNFHLSVMVIFFFRQFPGPVSWTICHFFNFWHFFNFAKWQKVRITKIPTLK